MSLKWIAVRSKPRSEKIVSIELSKKNIESFLPIVKKRQQWSDRKKWVEFPLFPSYLFAKIELKDSIYILNTHGVSTIVKFGDRVITIEDKVVNSIKLALKGEYDLHPIKYFTIGDRVSVIDGPMKGAIGIVETKHKNKNRLVIKIEALQQAITVHINSEYLEYIKD
ncbi:MAG: UpxY family transcription antiterminator [Candidatus Marinimicrobia bacterium]|jgi:transcriptional antiterminator RfaH|nr:UpxY family transcription antiterminator [Candidatus Neomarinimicrobiota bacterium]